MSRPFEENTAHLQMTHLIVEWEIRDVDFAGKFQDSWWDLQHMTGVTNNIVNWICRVEVLVGTEMNIRNSSFPHDYSDSEQSK